MIIRSNKLLVKILLDEMTECWKYKRMLKRYNFISGFFSSIAIGSFSSILLGYITKVFSTHSLQILNIQFQPGQMISTISYLGFGISMVTLIISTIITHFIEESIENMDSVEKYTRG